MTSSIEHNRAGLVIDRAAFDFTVQALMPSTEPQGNPDTLLLVIGTRAVPVLGLDQAYADASAAVAAGRDVYFNLASVTGATSPQFGHVLRSTVHLSRFAVLWAELDCGQGKPHATREDALVHLSQAVSRGLPEPSYLINSGGGVHIYWKFAQSVDASELVPMLPVWRACMDKLGLVYDKAALIPTQILRVAGTFNFKHGGVRSVEFMPSCGGLYDWSVLADWMWQVAPEAEVSSVTAGTSHEIAGRFSIDWLRSELSKVEPDTTREAWLQVAFGLAGETGCSEEGYQLFCDWSMGAVTGMPVPQYDEAACAKAWNSMQDTRSSARSWGEGVVERLFERKENDVTASRAARTAEMVGAVGAQGLAGSGGVAGGQTLETGGVGFQLAGLPALADPTVGLSEEREDALVKEAAKQRAEEARVKQAASVAAAVAAGLPVCLQNVCFDRSVSKFYDFETGVLYETDGKFNAAFEQRLFVANCVKKVPPATQARLMYGMVEVDGSVYRPSEGMVVQEATRDGVVRNYRNTYPMVGRMPVPDEVTPEGQKAVDMLKLHVLHGLCDGDEVKGRALLSTLMWYLKHPGVRLGTLLYIAGASGIGKSILMSLVAKCYMDEAVVRLRTKDFTEGVTFNSHLAGGIMGFIDEMQGSGREHRLVADSFREMVTADTLSIESKGANRVNQKLTKNFALFTNYPDLVWLSANDRRTLYIRPRWETKEEMFAYMKAEFGIENYVEQLTDALLRHPAQILLAARNYVFPTGFGIDAEPLMTVEKRKVLETPVSAHSDSISMLLAACEDFTDPNDANWYIGVSRDMVSSLSVTRALRKFTGDDKLTTRQIGMELAGSFYRVREFTNTVGTVMPAVMHACEYHTIFCRKGVKEPTYADVLEMFKATSTRTPKVAAKAVK